MGRLVWYAGASTVLAGGVIFSAFHSRANFYSACVYLAGSNLCLMILINLILLIYGTIMYGLQRLCYGPLRPIEIEQLYEKAWFAITETCLAMTIFREEVGAWFLVMFVALLTGKVWGWIGGGRVEILEQQPPANPRLFHIRLSISLTVSVLYDAWLMSYAINTVIQQARPNMMVMFLFEFAVLTTSSFSTAFRYGISLIEASVVQKQTTERLFERRREVREERAEMIRQREAAATEAGDGAVPSTAGLPSEDDVDEMDIEVPGWEAKGQWVLSLDLVTDFVKLAIYSTFFFILLTFYGLPIHILRDLFITARSFVKRLTAFLRYRRATHDMNERYEDATVEDISREDTCIICREEMRPWSVTNPVVPPAGPGAPQPARPAAPVNERSRPKKLPCGHILHLGCLKSWLERQQVCPTCRRSVVENAPPARPAARNANRPGPGQPPAPGQQDGAPGGPPPVGNRMRMLRVGPLRLAFGQANLQDLPPGLGGPQPGQPDVPPRAFGLDLGFQRVQPQAPGATNLPGTGTYREQLLQIEQQIIQEIRSLGVAQHELRVVQLLQNELASLRRFHNVADPVVPQVQTPFPAPARHVSPQRSQFQRHGVRAQVPPIPAGSANLPPGLTIPEGWSLLPLERFDGVIPPLPGSAGLAPTTTSSPIIPNSNNTPAAAPTTNTENHSQTSSGNSNTNAVHAPPSVSADQPIPSLLPDTTIPNTTPSASILTTEANPSGSSLHSNSSGLFLSPRLNDGSDIENTKEVSPPAMSSQGTTEVVPPRSGPVTGESSQSAENRNRGKSPMVEDMVDE
ncbi:hypothetical protein B7494_g6513 [Chlorociboria aeruginascens]|nr:hypothetical protein B7494_g6513 [Chlorociboria aeruginascens]